MASRISTDRPILSLVVDRRLAGPRLEAAVEAAVREGVDLVQVRERGLEGAEWLAHAEHVAAAARRGRGDVRICVNRRVDVALCIGAQAVHLGFDAMPVTTARALLGERAWIGVSAHDAGAVRAARDAGADYAHLAPIFAPLSKPAERRALGANALREAARTGLPVLAQGGVEADRCPAILAAGAAGIAVTGAILMAEDPGAAAGALRRALDRAA
jgi:thiamine-phosphate pyrophosphorylase